jgi:hypothetical protein
VSNDFNPAGKPPADAKSARRQDKSDPLSADLQAHIGRRLKAFYDGVVSEPVPDRFSRLLEKLDSPADIETVTILPDVKPKPDPDK